MKTSADPRPGREAQRLEVVQATDQHAAQLAEFFRQVWDPNATPESVAESRAQSAVRNVAEPGLPPPTWVALQAGKVLGYVTSIPIRLWDGHHDRPGYWVKGLMVLPEFRKGPIGYLVLKAAVAGLPRSGAIAAAPAALRLFTALGYSDLGPIPNWVQPLAPHRMLQRLNLDDLGVGSVPPWAPAAMRVARATGIGAVAGWLGGIAVRAVAAGLRLPAAGVESGAFDPTASPEELDALWSKVCQAIPAGVVRNARYLMERYTGGGESPYVWLAVRDRGSLAAVAILRKPRLDADPRLGGMRLATLVDVLHAPSNTAGGLALLGAVERAARALGADAVLATCSAPSVGALLRRQCYLPVPGNVHFLFRDVSPDGSGFGRSLGDWWLTRGDGLSDGAF